VKVVDDKVIVIYLNNINLNLVVLPNEYLHTLEAGVTAKFRDREKHALSLISEYWVNNEHMFVE